MKQTGDLMATGEPGKVTWRAEDIKPIRIRELGDDSKVDEYEYDKIEGIPLRALQKLQVRPLFKYRSLWTDSHATDHIWQVSVVKVGSFNTVWKSVGQHARKKGGVYIPVYGTSYLTVSAACEPIHFG